MPERVVSDGGGEDTGPEANGVREREDAAEKWDRAGRDAVANLVEIAHFDVDGQIRDLVFAMRGPDGDDPTPEDVREIRGAVNELRRHVENHLAPAAGLEPWRDDPPHMPKRAAREHYGDCGGDDE